MNDHTDDHAHGHTDGHGSDGKPVTGDRLDALLRAWHDENRDAASAMRDGVLRAAERERHGPGGIAGRIGFLRAAAAAAAIAGVVALIAVFSQNTEKRAFADGGVVQVAEGGALDALDDEGNTLGPCPLQHTDVKVEISGLFARTVVEQTYANPYPRTIEAVYTFPLSNRAAVDRMTMVVRASDGSEKFIEGEVKERSVARAIYEDARESGHVASLLEEERPNIFTQSVANIEPGATVKVRIATIELARRVNGVAEYVFPMVVGPRYIPGAAPSMPALPAGWRVRAGVVLRGPAGVEIAKETPFAAGTMLALLERAVPVEHESPEAIDAMLQAPDAVQFTARYGGGGGERGTYFPSLGLGEINGRFFHAKANDAQGSGFASDTDQVPDASRITPMPVRPTERAGHDISVRVTIASGGPAITDVASELHAVAVDARSASERTVVLDDRRTIPNRDFILKWKVADASIEPSFFAHTANFADAEAKGGYFALMLEPPARIAPAEVRPRELVFVLDTSGSMGGFPIEKSKALARKAIASMRANDTFNIITFAGATSVLWPEPRAASDENRRIADQFVEGAYGSGGTEMMTAVNTALVQDGRSGLVPARLLDLPADGRAVRVVVAPSALSRNAQSIVALVEPDGTRREIRFVSSIALPANPKSLDIVVDGTWETRDGDRVLVARTARFEDVDARTRLVFFLTDGYIGNEDAVVQAVRDNARASRVFAFGIGNSVNRSLLEQMARAGRGVCEVVTLAEEADGVVERLVRRIESPVLTDIALSVSPELGLHDMLPAGEHLPDLFDEEPIVLLGRFDRAATGSITLRGRTGAGAWERSIAVTLPGDEPGHDVVPTLWARAKVEAVLAGVGGAEGADPRAKREIVRLGETYRIATPFTSFVAVEKSRVVVGGRPMLVSVPVELPDGTNWNGFFESFDAIERVAAFGRDGGQAVRGAIETVVEEARGRGLLAPQVGGGGLIGSAGDDFGVGFGRVDSPQVAPAAGRPSAPSGGFGGGGGGGSGGAAAANNAPLPAISAPPAPTSAAPSAAPADPASPGQASGGKGRTGGLTGGLVGGEAKNLGKLAENTGERSQSSSVVPPGRLLERQRMARDGAAGTPRFAAPSREAESLSRGLPGGGGFAKQGAIAADARSRRVAELNLGVPVDAKDRGAEPREEAGELLDAAGSTGDAFGAPAPRETAGAPAMDLDRLARVLEERLLVVALAVLVDDADALRTLVAELGLATTGEGARLELLVAMKIDAASFEPSVAALRACGVLVEAEDPARGLLVARIPANALPRAALVEGVRRIEVRAPAEGGDAR